MELSEFLQRLINGEYVAEGSEMHLLMHSVSQNAIKICSEINSGYHTTEEIRQLMSELT